MINKIHPWDHSGSSAAMNLTVTSTQELPTSSNLVDDEHYVLGLPAVDFYAIHYLALVVLACSIIVSSGVLVHLLACSGTAFRGRPIGERLVVYLAFCDLIYRWEDTWNDFFLGMYRFCSGNRSPPWFQPVRELYVFKRKIILFLVTGSHGTRASIQY